MSTESTTAGSIALVGELPREIVQAELASPGPLADGAGWGDRVGNELASPQGSTNSNRTTLHLVGPGIQPRKVDHLLSHEKERAGLPEDGRADQLDVPLDFVQHAPWVVRVSCPPARNDPLLSD